MSVATGKNCICFICPVCQTHEKHDCPFSPTKKGIQAAKLMNEYGSWSFCRNCDSSFTSYGFVCEDGSCVIPNDDKQEKKEKKRRVSIDVEDPFYANSELDRRLNEIETLIGRVFRLSHKDGDCLDFLKAKSETYNDLLRNCTELSLSKVTGKAFEEKVADFLKQSNDLGSALEKKLIAKQEEKK